MSSPRSIAACQRVASGSSIRGASSRSDENPQKPHTSESPPESPQSVLCTTVPSLQTTSSPLQTIYKPSVFDIFQSSSSPLSSSPSLPRPITLQSDAYSTVANATTNPAIVTMTTLDDKQNRSLVMVAILVSLTITALTYLESHATDSGTFLLCAISVAMAHMANSVLLSCMDSASDLISTLSSMMGLMLGSDKLSPRGRKAAKRIVWNGFGRDNGRRSRMDICMSLRIR